jgi:hypothetical protein
MGNQEKCEKVNLVNLDLACDLKRNETKQLFVKRFVILINMFVAL